MPVSFRPGHCVPQSLCRASGNRSAPQVADGSRRPAGREVAATCTEVPALAAQASSGLGQAERLPSKVADAMSALNASPTSISIATTSQGTRARRISSATPTTSMCTGIADKIDLNQLAWRMRAERDVPLRGRPGQRKRCVRLEPALSRTITAAPVLDQGQQARVAWIRERSGKHACQQSAVDGRRASTARTVKRLSPINVTAAGRWRNATEDVEMTAKCLVIAAGAWSARLLSPLGVHVPLEAERGYHLVLRDPGVTLNNSIMDTEHKFVASSMRAGVRCAGTAEFAGLDAPPDYRRAQVFKRLASKLFPDINTADTEEWMGARPSLPDSLPCIGPIPGFENLYGAFGHCHHGFGMAPATGRLVANLVRGVEPNIDLSPYSIERFA